MFLRWKGQVYKQLFYIMSANASPNLLSRDSYYMLGVLKPCYTVKTTKRSSTQTPKQASNLANDGNNKEDQPDSTEHVQSVRSNFKEHHWRKWTSLRLTQTYSSGFGKFPGPSYKFQLKPNAKLARHAPRWVHIHLTRSISSGNQEFGASRDSQTHQRNNQMGKQFHHSGEESWPHELN